MIGDLKAYVYRDRLSRRWQVVVDDPVSSCSWSGSALSWPEALQHAHVMLRDLDRQLMDQVHASRAKRRSVAVDRHRCTHGRLLVCHDCQDELQDTHTMEATA